MECFILNIYIQINNNIKLEDVDFLADSALLSASILT